VARQIRALREQDLELEPARPILALSPAAEQMVIEDTKANAQHRCPEDRRYVEVVPSKNLEIENS
jgi:hypothetical protein